MKRLLFIVLLLGCCSMLFAQTPAPTPGPPPPVPLPPLPWWALTLVPVLMSLGVEGIKKLIPKAPAWMIPILNLALATLLAYGGKAAGVVAVDPTNVVAIAGGSGLLYNLAKNVARGDKVGEASVVQKQG